MERGEAGVGRVCACEGGWGDGRERASGGHKEEKRKGTCPAQEIPAIPLVWRPACRMPKSWFGYLPVRYKIISM